MYSSTKFSLALWASSLHFLVIAIVLELGSTNSIGIIVSYPHTNLHGISLVGKWRVMW